MNLVYRTSVATFRSENAAIRPTVLSSDVTVVAMPTVPVVFGARGAQLSVKQKLPQTYVWLSLVLYTYLAIGFHAVNKTVELGCPILERFTIREVECSSTIASRGCQG